MGQPTQRATNYTARSNNEPAQIVLITHSHSGIDEKKKCLYTNHIRYKSGLRVSPNPDCRR